VAACLRIAEQIGLPIVVSSALETSVGLAAGLALAAALPELPYACGLATLQLLAGDVTTSPLVVVDGEMAVTRPEPDAMAAVRADDATVGRWRQRLVEVQAAQP
jgi:o-succinylbenzoate synthase